MPRDDFRFFESTRLVDVNHHFSQSLVVAGEQLCNSLAVSLPFFRRERDWQIRFEVLFRE